MTQTIHVIGAGLAGLSAAVFLAGKAKNVVVHEASGQAGGRCRSFYDETLGCRIDNGNHLVLSGNHATIKYLDRIGAKGVLVGPERAEFPFMDLRTGERWQVKPDRWIIPWSLMTAKGRVPGSSIGEYLRGLTMAWASPDKTISQCLQADGPLFDKFWEPLAVSVLNTEVENASAKLFWPVLRETFGRGAGSCIPLIAKEGLSESFVDPALDYLAQSKIPVLFNHRLRAIQFSADRLSSLDFGEEKISLDAGDQVILAVPPSVAAVLVPELLTPNDFRPIVNGHFQIPQSGDQSKFLGLVGGIAHWLFVRNGIASITVSAANELVHKSSEEIASQLWPDICQALGLGDLQLGLYRIIKEKRATFAQTPAQLARRPGTKTGWKNLFLAGDWTDTGLPATIEGTIRSGIKTTKMVI